MLIKSQEDDYKIIEERYGIMAADVEVMGHYLFYASNSLEKYRRRLVETPVGILPEPASYLFGPSVEMFKIGFFLVLERTSLPVKIELLKIFFDQNPQVLEKHISFADGWKDDRILLIVRRMVEILSHEFSVFQKIFIE